jgi:hypothetical protein
MRAWGKPGAPFVRWSTAVTWMQGPWRNVAMWHAAPCGECGVSHDGSAPCYSTCTICAWGEPWSCPCWMAHSGHVEAGFAANALVDGALGWGATRHRCEVNVPVGLRLYHLMPRMLTLRGNRLGCCVAGTQGCKSYIQELGCAQHQGRLQHITGCAPLGEQLLRWNTADLPAQQVSAAWTYHRTLATVL